MENKTEIVEETKPKKTTKKEEVKGWKEVFKANYDGTSEEAKALKPFLKETFKGDVYIPWADEGRLYPRPVSREIPKRPLSVLKRVFCLSRML